MKPARIGALAGRRDLGEADERARSRHGIVRPCPDIGHAGLADELDRMRRQAAQRCEAGHQRLQRTAQLIFRRTGNRWIGQLGFCRLPEGRDDRFQTQAGHAIPPLPQP